MARGDSNCYLKEQKKGLALFRGGWYLGKEFRKLLFQTVSRELNGYFGSIVGSGQSDWYDHVFPFHAVAGHVDLEGSTYKALEVVGFHDGQNLLKRSFGGHSPNQRFVGFFACRHDKLVLYPLVASFECGGSPDRIGYDPDLVDFSDFWLEEPGQLSSVLVHCFPYRHFISSPARRSGVSPMPCQHMLYVDRIYTFLHKF